jgi:hypothetical protein
MGRNIGIGMAHFAQRGPRLALKAWPSKATDNNENEISRGEQP